MLRYNLWITGLLAVSACGGCSNMDNTAKDGLMGAGAGAAAGALLTRGNPVGAVVGGLFGGLVGTSIGNSQDRKEATDKYVSAVAANQARNQMLLTDIVQLSQNGTPPGIIIQQINATGSVFNLRSEDITYLRQQRVDDQVISVMLSRRYGGPVVVQPGGVIMAGPPAVVYVDPPPPPVAVGVGVGFGGRYR